MTELINVQFNMLVVALLLGILMGLTYDGLRCIRRVILHNLFFVSVEDFIYWFLWTIIVLDSITLYNYGELRVYIFFAMLVGFAVYKATIGWVIMRVFNYMWYPIKKNMEKVKKNLKNHLKKSKI